MLSDFLPRMKQYCEPHVGRVLYIFHRVGVIDIIGLDE